MTRLVVVIAALAAFAFPSAAIAQVTQRTVTRFDDPQPDGCATNGCSLREAVTEGSEPTLEVTLPSAVQEYVLTSGLGIGRDNVTLRGPSTGLATIRLAPSAPADLVVSVGAQLLSVSIHRVRITGGHHDDEGGGLEVNPGAALNVFDSEIVGNRAVHGGGIWNAGTINLERTTVAGNVATGAVEVPGRGGGILNEGTAGTLTNSTVSANSAALGGGIYTTGTLSIEYATIAGNTATSGGGLYVSDGNTSMLATLLADNQGASCAGTSGVVSEEHNLAEDASCAFTSPNDRVVADARIAPLSNYGGLTRTRALYTGSPAIGGVPAVNCAPQDQRQVTRTAPCDIGAFEGSIAPPSPPPPPPPPPPPQDEELPPPVVGKRLNALPVRGTVRIRLPGTSRFVRLTEGQQIPVGTVIDTRKGRVTLVAASNKSGGTARATFYAGLFRLSQSSGARPITTLTLIEKLRCPKSGKASVAAKRKKKRRLWGDGKGRFRTKGEYSSATVRGTKWLTEDSCRSTLTRVTKGRVTVRDFVKRKTVIVRAGKRYVAKRNGR